MHTLKNYKKTLSLFAIIFFIVSTSFLSEDSGNEIYSDFGGWVKLGTKTVSPGVDSDELDITETKESFHRLKFKVSKAPVYIRNVRIIYNDNTSESHIITRHFQKGDASRVLDLVGYERLIKKVIFSYRRRNSGQKRANLVVMAKI